MAAVRIGDRLDGMRERLAAALTAALMTCTTATATAGTAGFTGTRSVPPLDPAALHAAISGLPDDGASAALARVRGWAGRWDGTSGVADIRSRRPVPPHARFRIGSITKVFTSVAALHLVARGDLDLDRTVQHYAPGLLPERYPPVPVRALLNHTPDLPGVPIGHKDPDWFLVHRFDSWTPRQMLDLAFSGREMEFAPGAKQHYGNRRAGPRRRDRGGHRQAVRRDRPRRGDPAAAPDPCAWGCPSSRG